VDDNGKKSFAPLKLRAAGAHACKRRSLADAVFLNDFFVALGVVGLKVIEQATTPAHHHKKTAPGGMILLVGLEVLRQLANALAEDRNLHLWTSGICGVRAVLTNDALLMLSR